MCLAKNEHGRSKVGPMHMKKRVHLKNGVMQKNKEVSNCGKQKAKGDEAAWEDMHVKKHDVKFESKEFCGDDKTAWEDRKQRDT
eukprot:9060534-Ditylum_brightwellii.AAC.1